MNYRHAYHAGNFADCFKHALLVALLDTFGRKPAPYFVVDTHAGAGQYDLEAAEAQRVPWDDGGKRGMTTGDGKGCAVEGIPPTVQSIIRVWNRGVV